MGETFGDVIREIRERHNYRQVDLAEAIGAKTMTMSHWETNRHKPSRSFLEQLIQRFPMYRARLYVAARLLPLQLSRLLL